VFSVHYKYVYDGDMIQKQKIAAARRVASSKKVASESSSSDEETEDLPISATQHVLDDELQALVHVEFPVDVADTGLTGRTEVRRLDWTLNPV